MRILLSLATAISILAVAVLLLMTPIWTHYVIPPATAATFATPQMAIELSDRTINELLFGPGTFTYFSADEAAHMRDVRVVLYGFLLIALIGAVFMGASMIRASRDPAAWVAIARGGIWLIATIVVLGIFALIAFQAAFTLFHEVFFPGGNWAFPPDSWLIRLYPEQFWVWTSFALGGLAVLGGLGVWWFARRRAARLMPA